MEPYQLHLLNNAFGERLKLNASLKRYTTAQAGGPVDALVEVRSASELAQAVNLCWEHDLQYFILGGGSNILVSDLGVRGVAVLNRARRWKFDEHGALPGLWAESGANLSLLSRQAAERGLTGLEWASGIPGTLGGAVVGNAGAHGSDMQANLLVAEILHHFQTGVESRPQRESWPVERLEYTYRSSLLKRQQEKAVVLAAQLRLEKSSSQAVHARMDELLAYRRRTQPPGASMGSMFKNPPGDYAGRLIEAAGLKGLQVGKAQISPLHANFFINCGGATAAEIYTLLQHARQAVFEKFEISLELEIELLGEWQQVKNLLD